MLNLFKAILEVLYSAATDIITIATLTLFFIVLWDTSKIFTLIVVVSLILQVVMVYREKKNDI